MKTTQCPACDSTLARGILCKGHRKSLSACLIELRINLYELQKVARREIKIGSKQGHAKKAYPDAPLDLGSQDLLDQVETVLAEAGATIALYGMDSIHMLRAIISHFQRLCSSPYSGESYRNITNIALKVQQRLTPPEEHVIYGDCLNPECAHELVGVIGQKEVTCAYCGSIWQVSAAREARREKLSERVFTGKPSEAARWMQQQTGLPVKPQNVKDWLRYDKLPSSTKAEARGEYDFNVGELLFCCETTRLAA